MGRAEELIDGGRSKVEAHRWPHLEDNEAIDRRCVIFCMAAGSVWTSRQCVDCSADQAHRGWPVEAKVAPLAAPTPEGWRCKPIGLTVWRGLRSGVAN